MPMNRGSVRLCVDNCMNGLKDPFRQSFRCVWTILEQRYRKYIMLFFAFLVIGVSELFTSIERHGQGTGYDIDGNCQSWDARLQVACDKMICDGKWPSF